MTTATAPPLLDPPAIDVAELPALDQPDERVCEFLDRPYSDGGEPCGKPATWAVTYRCDQPEHDKTQMALTCDQHLGSRAMCSGCWIHGGIRRGVRVLRAERLR